MELAIDFARKNNFDGYLAVGGGSVMDTAKVANLFDIYRENELLDFVNAPIGKGKVEMLSYINITSIFYTKLIFLLWT